MFPAAGAKRRDLPERKQWLGEEEPLPPEDRTVTQAQVVWLDALYRSHSPKLLRFLTRRTACRDEARDLLHDIFCRLARRPSVSAPIGNPEAYLTRIAANLLNDRAKSAVRRHADFHVSEDEIVLPAMDPQRHLETRDILDRLEAAMLRLKPKTREIFMAHRLDGLSYAEIAGRTGLSVKGVEKQMSKAIEQIDRHLHRR